MSSYKSRIDEYQYNCFVVAAAMRKTIRLTPIKRIGIEEVKMKA